MKLPDFKLYAGNGMYKLISHDVWSSCKLNALYQRGNAFFNTLPHRDTTSDSK